MWWARNGAALDALGAATRVIYPQSGYHTEDVAEGTKVQRKNIRIVALADLFQDRLDRCRGELKKLGIEIDEDSCYTGFDGYEKVLGRDDVNYVILATPPHFRPQHLLAAVKAGKHAFIEKPAAVDVPGVKTVMEAGQLAAKKKVGIVAGTQRRHMENYQETIRRIQEARSANSSLRRAIGMVVRFGLSTVNQVGVIWSGSYVTGITSRGCRVTITWSSTYTTWTL